MHDRASPEKRRQWGDRNPQAFESNEACVKGTPGPVRDRGRLRRKVNGGGIQHSLKTTSALEEEQIRTNVHTKRLPGYLERGKDYRRRAGEPPKGNKACLRRGD